MDSLTTAAVRALAAGDPLGALNRVALRDDPPALALRGIAMAQLGEYPRSRELLKRAPRGFGVRETLARARCVVAEAVCARCGGRNGKNKKRGPANIASPLAARKCAACRGLRYFLMLIWLTTPFTPSTARATTSARSTCVWLSTNPLS